MSSPDIPKSPDPAKSYAAEIQTYLANLPTLLQAEQDARATYDPQRVASQQQLQAQFGPTQYAQQLDALHQLDPAGSIIRDQLGSAVSGDLASGYALPPDFANELENNIRGASVARGGSSLGNAPITAETAYKGKAALDLYQQHLDNAGQFLGLATPEQQISQITPVSADRSSAYVNPSAGFLGQNLAVQNYGNQLGQYQAQAAVGNPWARALSGTASGAATGATVGGGWGALLGGVAGGVGGYLSSRNLKENIREIARTQSGLPVVVFNYLGHTTRKFIGTIAEEVAKITPEAVITIDGKLGVNYNLTDCPFIEL